jgi:hypothetical protein
MWRFCVGKSSFIYISSPSHRVQEHGDWQPNALCVCGSSWLRHTHLQEWVFAFITSGQPLTMCYSGALPVAAAILPGPPVLPPPSFRPPRSPGVPPILGSSQPLLHAYQGLLAVVQGMAGTRRASSAAVSLVRDPFSSLTSHRTTPRRPFSTIQADPMVDVLVICWPDVLVCFFLGPRTDCRC